MAVEPEEPIRLELRILEEVAAEVEVEAVTVG